MRARRRGARPPVAVLVALAAAMVALTGVVGVASSLHGCSAPEPTVGASGDQLTPGITYYADLDGDDGLEEILVERSPAALLISDGDDTYQSRDKWQVVEAFLGDTDHDGLLEIVALLDDEAGRHLGLFSFFGGRYRERLVTSELTPRPLALQVLPGEEGEGDLVLLTEETTPGGTGARSTTYRWNGFGFTALGL